MSGKTSVLVLASNPKDTPALRLDQEVREIQVGLLRSHRKGFSVRQDWAVRPRDIRRALLEHRPTIVHFCGHGSGEEGLVFEDDRGKSHLVSSRAIANLFKLFSAQVKCVVLNACFSENQAHAIAHHIDYVVGMSREIQDQAAIEFALGFYDAIAAGESYETAFQFGCNAIELSGLRGERTPVLTTRETATRPGHIQEPEASSHRTAHRSATKAVVVRQLNELLASGWSLKEVMARLEEIDYSNISGLDPLSAGVISQWLPIAECNPDGYSFLVDGYGQIVGYWHFEALPENLYEKARKGELEDGEITVENVVIPCRPGLIEIYFIIFVVDRSFRGFKSNRLLLDALLDRLEEFVSAGISPRRICANAFTPEGVGLCKSLGLRPVGTHRRTGLIFELHLEDLILHLPDRPRLRELLEPLRASCS